MTDERYVSWHSAGSGRHAGRRTGRHRVFKKMLRPNGNNQQNFNNSQQMIDEQQLQLQQRLINDTNNQ